MQSRQKKDRARGIKSEKKAAEQYGGKTRPGSGSKWHSKQDIITPKFLMQHKDTEKLSHSVKVKSIIELEQDALIEDKLPLFRIKFSKHKMACILMPEWVLYELIGKVDV